MSLSVLTIVRNRAAHLDQLIEGLRRSDQAPDELIIVDMSDSPVSPAPTSFPVRIERMVTDGLPLAAARNRAAAMARFERLIFLDVDCIPMRECVGRMADVLIAQDALLCADVRYLGPHDARGDWTEDMLLAYGRRHPVRTFPDEGVREEANPGLFWSLAFAIRRDSFRAIGGFDEGFEGYGGEDTDLGFRAVGAGHRLLFVGGAVACHQYHESFEPPLQHLTDIVRNANYFREKWGKWPMDGWLRTFADKGLISWSDKRIEILRKPSRCELEAARQEWPAAAQV
jgi:GT2 family glycosyltransferase